MQSQIESQIEALAAEKIESEQTQKTNLEEQNHHKHHVSKKHKKSRAHHRKGHQGHAHSLMQTTETLTDTGKGVVVATPPKTETPKVAEAPAKVAKAPAPSL
jgi:hypothetical protein